MGDPYFGQLTISSLDLSLPGTYEMTYHVVMFCDGAVCANAGDSIKVIVNEDNENIADLISYDNIAVQRRWVKRSLRFTIEKPEIEVCWL